MSTKTTFKRIALVAVAALGLGTLSIVPSAAAITAATGTLTVAAATVDAPFGGASSTAAGSVTYGYTAGGTGDTVAITASITTNVTGATSTVALGAISSATNATAPLTGTNTIATVTPAAAGAVAGTHAVTLTANKAGKYVVTLTPDATGIAAGMSAKTITFTLAALYATTGDGLASGTASKSTVNAVAGPANTVTLTVVEQGTTPRLVTVSGGSIASTAAGTIATGGASMVLPIGSSATTRAFVVATPTVGTITANVFDESAPGIYSTTATSTVTITVGAAAQSGTLSVANSTSFLNATTGIAATADATVSAAAALPSAQVAQVVVTLKDTLLAPYSGAISATITGPGTLGAGNAANPAATGRAVTSANAAATQYVSVWSDGTTGTSVITLSVGSTVIATETVSFYGPLATLTATVVNKQILTSAVATGAVTVVGKDASGNTLVVTPVVSSATAASIASGTCSASTATTASSCNLTAGATAGSSVLTFTVGAISTTATVSAAAKPTAVALAFDKTEYALGEAFTLTLTASNAAGVPGDATYANLLAGALTTSASITSTLFGASVALVDGKATVKGFMPLAAGPVTVSGTTGADAFATGATAGVAVTATTTVLSDGIAQAAVDAAAEATDAANAATDAANAAAEAADAATAAAQDAADAVAALSTQVSEMINALKKQITALTNLVIKIQKKVKA